MMDYKKMKEPTKEERDELGVIMYNIMFTNDICNSAVYDALERLRKTKYFRNGVKRWWNVCSREIKDYNRKLDEHTGGKIDFVAELNDSFADDFQNDMLKLYATVQNEFNRKRIPESELMSYLWVADVFVNGACNNCDQSLAMNPNITGYTKSFRWMRLTRLMKAYTHMMSELRKMTGVEITDETDSLNIYNGFKIVANKLADPQRIIDKCNEVSEEWQDK